MNSFGVSVYLTSLLAFVIIALRRKVGKNASIKVLYWLLFLMVSPGFILDVQHLFFWGKVGYENLTLFFGLLILTAIPWIKFDKWYKHIPSIKVTDHSVKLLSTIFIIVILSCLFSYVYIFPYAMRSFAMGAAETRGAINIQRESVMPENILTTLTVAVSTISPFYVFFFFLSRLHPSLKKYSLWLFLSSFIYIVVSMPFMARDGFVTLPVFYLVFYLLLKKSLVKSDRRKIKLYFSVVASITGSLLIVYSISRFYDNRYGTAITKFIGGTWGYLFQQPYVFDRTVNYQHLWHGVDLRFPILSFLSNKPIEVVRTQDFETMFGTMLSEFYSIGGYWSLFVFTGGFILVYYFGLCALFRRMNYFSIFLFFITYLMIEVTGLFYYRYGGISFNWLFLILTILPFFFKKNIIVLKNE